MDRIRCRERVVVFNGFSKAELEKMDELVRKSGEESLGKNFCYKVAKSFNRSSGRAGKPVVKWTEVHSWLQSRIHDYPSKVISSPSTSERLSTPTEVSPTKKSNEILQNKKGEKRSDIEELEFEARSNKDGAWYDIDKFLAHRFVASGEAEAQIRFIGFGPQEDEWVNIKSSVRERSRPLESSECHTINVGDYVLCFQERKDQAIHFDAHVLEIKRRRHDIRGCRCIFLVHYDHDNTEARTGSVEEIILQNAEGSNFTNVNIRIPGLACLVQVATERRSREKMSESDWIPTQEYLYKAATEPEYDDAFNRAAWQNALGLGY